MASTLSDSQPVSLANGTLADATVVSGTTIQGVLNAGGGLSHITLAGTLSEQAQVTKLSINGGLTLNGGTILMANINDVTFNGTQTLGGTGTIVYNNGDNRDRIDVGGTGSVLTIGPNITVRGNAGQFNADGGSIINQGTIDDDTGGAGLSLNGSWTSSWNDGGNGLGLPLNQRYLDKQWFPGRYLRASLALNGSWTNTGTLSMANSSLYLEGRLL